MLMLQLKLLIQYCLGAHDEMQLGQNANYTKCNVKMQVRQNAKRTEYNWHKIQNSIVTKCKCDKIQYWQNAIVAKCKCAKLKMGQNVNVIKCKFDKMLIKIIKNNQNIKARKFK